MNGKLLKMAGMLVLLASPTLLAEAPASGVVIEGVSAPGVSLGDSRAELEAAYGSPLFCQSVEAAGDMAACDYPVEGGGQVSIRYRGPDGGNAANSPADLTHAIRWYEAVSGWVTTTGVNTALAKTDPDAVLDAYPNGEVAYNMFGDLYRLTDRELGVEVIWALNFYTGLTHVNMAIFGETIINPPPPPDQQTHVADIELSSSRKKRVRRVDASVEIQNESGEPAGAALVRVHWVLPDSSAVDQLDVTSLSGFAHFNLSGIARGNYTLIVDEVDLENHDFDSGGSVLEASIRVK